MKRFLALLLSVLFCLILLPARQAHAENRTEVSFISASSNVSEIAVYGRRLTPPTFEIISGEPARMNQGVAWEKMVDGVWTSQTTGTFTIGTWRFRMQIRIDGEYGTTHTFSNDMTVYLDADLCTVTDVNLASTYSICMIISPTYTVGYPVYETATEIDPPRIGQYPSYTASVSADATYYIDPKSNDAWKDSVLWRDLTENRNLMPDTETFQEGHRYMVMIALTPKESYQFSNQCTATVNGGDAAVTNVFARNELIVSYDFETLRTGWREISLEWYYYDETGALAIGWKQIDGRWYYFNASGVMQKGWQKIGGSWYHFSTGGVMQTGWQKIANKWYYFNAGGVMQTGWQKIGNKWYYFNADGDMAVGWKQLNSKWYYFTGSGEMVTGWKQINSKWYHFAGSGAMQTGWQKIGNKWYYFNAGGDMVTGWKKLNNKWYYFESSGAMVTGAKTIASKQYYFASGGALIGSPNEADLQSVSFVLNIATMKFHKPGCKDVAKIQAANKVYFSGTRDEAVALGFTSCGHCKS